jgi:hypothetical protein
MHCKTSQKAVSVSVCLAQQIYYFFFIFSQAITEVQLTVSVSSSLNMEIMRSGVGEDSWLFLFDSRGFGWLGLVRIRVKI